MSVLFVGSARRSLGVHIGAACAVAIWGVDIDDCTWRLILFASHCRIDCHIRAPVALLKRLVATHSAVDHVSGESIHGGCGHAQAQRRRHPSTAMGIFLP